MAHVAEYKKRTVERFAKLIKEYPIIGVVNMENLPAPQLQKMRAQLRDKITLLMTKRRLLNLAIDKCKEDKKGIEGIKSHLGGMPAIIFTKENPFMLCKTLQKNKSKAPAKPGQIAPSDIIIPAGSTPFQPGPVIGELSLIGVKSGVEGGKVVIKKDSVVAKKGEVIKPEVASMLTRLGIQPMEIGLDLVAMYENGEIFTKDILSIDEQEYLNNIAQAALWSINLAIEIAYPTKETTEMLVAKAFNEAKALALEQNIMSDVVAEELVSKAERQMLSLKTEAKIEVMERQKEEKAEEVKPEQKKEEPKPEVKEARSTKPDATDYKVAEMVRKAKKFARGGEPKADDLLKEMR